MVKKFISGNDLHLHLVIIIFVLKLGHESAAAAAQQGKNGITSDASPVGVGIGVVLDLHSHVGAMARLCIDMARSDFYDRHPSYRTRLSFHTKDAEGVLGVVSAVLELLKSEEVHGILGPLTSAEAAIAVEFGSKTRVPVISFSASSLSLSRARTPYFVRAAPEDSSQVEALIAIFQEFQWPEVVILCEETDYGGSFIPHLIDAFQVADIRVTCVSSFSPSAQNSEILNELNKLKKMETKVFLVHMVTASLGSRLFALANESQMMNEEFVWLITDNLSNSLSTLDSSAIDSMEGVLGIKPYVPQSKELDDFRVRLRSAALMSMPESSETELNVYGLWAYDTVWALAMTVEKIGPMNYKFLKLNNTRKNAGEIENLGISDFGPRLLQEILNTKFKGLSGEFRLVDGQHEVSAYEIFNMIGKGKIVGYWTPERGITQKLSSDSKKKLGTIIWPGDTTFKPKGWTIPATAENFRVGVPFKKGFTEFVKIETNRLTNEKTVSGFCIDLFLAAWRSLPYKMADPKFVPFISDNGDSAGTYNDLLQKMHTEDFDAVVGDITIVADRLSYVDFTLPYSESGVVMIVPIKDKSKDIWIFLKPLSWDLWMAIVAACVLIGIVVRIMERHVNVPDSSVFAGSRCHRLGMLFWFPLFVLAFPERRMVANNWTRLVLVVWLFMSFVLMQSYTANLSAMLTLSQLQPAELKSCYHVGYQEGSFVKDLLVKRLKINSSRLKPYSTIEEFHGALSNGSENGGVDAIMDEIPYLKLFLDKYGSRYMMVGPTYRTDGFGFAFPAGSRLVKPLSYAILNLTEDGRSKVIENRYFKSDSKNPFVPIEESSGLTSCSFGGLFVITGAATMFALFCSEIPFSQIIVAMETYFCRNKVESEDESADGASVVSDMAENEGISSMNQT